MNVQNYEAEKGQMIAAYIIILSYQGGQGTPGGDGNECGKKEGNAWRTKVVSDGRRPAG